MTAQEALDRSYLTWDELMHGITTKAGHHETSLPYVLVHPNHIPVLKELGYTVFENVGDGNQTTIHWGEAIKGRYKDGKRIA